jgi:hypothetical protein
VRPSSIWNTSVPLIGLEVLQVSAFLYCTDLSGKEQFQMSLTTPPLSYGALGEFVGISGRSGVQPYIEKLTGGGYIVAMGETTKPKLFTICLPLPVNMWSKKKGNKDE